jgi:hypothetical protein
LVELLSHDDIHKTLAEAQRVLRPGGRFSLIVIGENKPIFRFMYRIGGAMIRAFWGRLVENDVPDMIRQSGMQIVNVHCLRQGYYPSRVLISEHAVEPALAVAASGPERKRSKSVRNQK